jgi:hypothetical protein
MVGGQAHRQHDTMDPLGLLRAHDDRRKHRGGRRAAEQGDEVSSSHAAFNFAR